MNFVLREINGLWTACNSKEIFFVNVSEDIALSILDAKFEPVAQLKSSPPENFLPTFLSAVGNHLAANEQGISDLQDSYTRKIDELESKVEAFAMQLATIRQQNDDRNELLEKDLEQRRLAELLRKAMPKLKEEFIQIATRKTT